MPIDNQLVQQVFTRAISITDAKEREVFLPEECGGNGVLLHRVKELLRAFDQPKPYFDQPTDLEGTVDAKSDNNQRPGNFIAGRYKLLEAIAEGGMGTVWVAEQVSPVKRKVALKLIKPGMDSRQVLARFDAERQALALMDHPNIAKVYDGGVTEQGRPYFAMEYVKGMPLTEYCDQARLPVHERLKLFVPICQAVQHAHQKGIIHRDLKPSNVLICLYDGKPVPKVIDFGLAKAMHQPLTEQTLHTGHGLMLGTPLYMSPEQAENNNLDVDTRSDVYSLGVMLYELLTGTTPLEKAQLKQAALGEILRLIKEVEPPKPSTRVSTSAQRASIAAQRSLDPEQLGRSISGDLDWIIMKALDKERNRRYETANGLARDIERFLNQEAVEACPPSASYRIKKQFQKHRVAITTAAAFLLLLTFAAVVSAWQAVRATRAEYFASHERDKAIANERQALEAKKAESAARVAEQEARQSESQQRSNAELQRSEAEKQRDEAKRLQVEAIAKNTVLEKLSEEQRRALYVSDMNLVRLEAIRGNLPRMREILYAQLPIDRLDLRGLEWNYWYRYLSQAKKLRQISDTPDSTDSARPLVLPGGGIVAVPAGSGEVVQTISHGPKQFVRGARYAANGRAVFLKESSIDGASTSDGFAVYDPKANPKHWTYPDKSLDRVLDFCISRDGRFVAVIGEPPQASGKPASQLFVWTVDSQELILNRLENRWLNRVALNSDGSRIAAFCCDDITDQTSQGGEEREVLVAFLTQRLDCSSNRCTTKRQTFNL